MVRAVSPYRDQATPPRPPFKKITALVFLIMIIAAITVDITTLVTTFLPAFGTMLTMLYVVPANALLVMNRYFPGLIRRGAFLLIVALAAFLLGVETLIPLAPTATVHAFVTLVANRFWYWYETRRRARRA